MFSKYCLSKGDSGPPVEHETCFADCSGNTILIRKSQEEEYEPYLSSSSQEQQHQNQQLLRQGAHWEPFQEEQQERAEARGCVQALYTETVTASQVVTTSVTSFK